MNNILQIWSTSPLNQFTIRNLSSLKTDLLGNIQISLTNIGLYLIIATVIAFMFYIIRQNHWTFNPPKVHAFIKTELNNATLYGIPGVDIVTVIATHLVSMMRSYATLDTLYQTSGLATTLLVSNIELIIRGIMEINANLPVELNSGQNFNTLTQMHTHLTGHLMNIHRVTYLLQHVIGFSGGSPDLNQLQDLMMRLSNSTRILLYHYRGVESAIAMDLINSPISPRLWGF